MCESSKNTPKEYGGEKNDRILQRNRQLHKRFLTPLCWQLKTNA